MNDHSAFSTRARRRSSVSLRNVCCEQLEERRLLSGRGLAGYYFEGTDFTSAKFARPDTQIQFEWTGGTPNSTIAPGGFGVRWSGRVLPKFSETYHFYTRTTGGVRVWVDGNLIIDDWSTHPLKDNKGSIQLNANQRYELRMEYFDTGSAARAELHWASKRQAREVIPQNRLFASERDVTPPTEPHKLRATYVTDSAFKWMWSAATDESDTIIYETYIGRTKLGTTTGTSFARGGRMPDMGYSVTVRAIDFAGNVSYSKPLLIKTEAPMVKGAGRGLASMYFREPDFTGFGLTRTDPTLDFTWTGTPFDDVKRPFSARWEGVVEARYEEAHTFALITDGAARVWLNDRLLIDAAAGKDVREHHAVVKLRERQRYTIRVDYEHDGGNPTLKLLWWGLSTGRQPIPASQLFPKFVDSVAPEAPTGLLVDAATDESITLRWREPLDDVGVAKYDVYRFGAFVRSVTEPRFIDTSLAPDTAYSYTVVAVDGAARRSQPSSPYTARTAPAPRSALTRIPADSYNDASGVSRLNGAIVSLDDGDWVKYSRIDFGSSGSVKSWNVKLGATVANAGGTIELRIGSPTGQLIGTHTVQPTGSYSSRLDQRVGSIAGPSGVHDLYLVFKGRNGVAEIESFQFSTQRLVRVMAIGDSITTSWANQLSYRYHLYKKLLAGGHGVDFVGSQTRAWNGSPPNFDFDQQHEAYTGYRVEQYLPRIVEWVTAANPEVMMIHLGTNDIWQGQSASGTVSEMGQLIDLIRSVNPNIKILLAQIVPLYDHDAQIAEYNAGLAQLAANRNRPQSPVVLVDQNTGFSFATDMLDVAHPNGTGEMKMADRWYDALVPLLS